MEKMSLVTEANNNVQYSLAFFGGRVERFQKPAHKRAAEPRTLPTKAIEVCEGQAAASRQMTQGVAASLLLFCVCAQGGGGGGRTKFVHGRSRITIDPRIPTMSGRRTSGFHQPGRHCLHQARSAVRCS